MQEYNVSPYKNQTDSLSNIPVTPLMIDHLRATKPWVRFMSVMSFIGAGFMVLAGLLLVVMPAGPGMERFGLGPLVGVIYILFAAIYIAPAYFLHQFASSIGNLMKGGGDVAMEAALASQKSFAIRRYYDSSHRLSLRTNLRLCHIVRHNKRLLLT